jgi:hypothetical protein
VRGGRSLNVTKKVIAVIVIAVIIIRAFTIETFALAGAPVIAAEEITALLETALIGSGLYNESELDGKNYNELNDLLKDGINSGQINPKVNYFTDPITEIKFSLLELLTKPEVQAGIDVSNAILSSIADDVISDFFSDYTKLSDSVVLTPTVDLKGHGALFVRYRPDGTINYRCYCDYISLNGSTTMLHGKLHYVYYDSHGKIQREKDRDMGDSFVGTTTSSIDKHYGDVRNHLDGTQVETDDEAIPVIGEADGTQVTPDMLNPDGTVTIDGTTYYPKDFIDWDKFKDPAIIDLLNQILDAIDNAYVFDDSVPDSIPGDVAVEVPAELSDFTTPGIANVFPFCLPWDFVRGMHLLKSEPEVPHFETEIKIPAFLNVPEQKWKLEIDFKEFEPLARITRWCSLLSFVYVLILITPKICKGAG